MISQVQRRYTFHSTHALGIFEKLNSSTCPIVTSEDYLVLQSSSLTIQLRYALNFKQIHYQTHWVELPDVKSTRIALDVPPVRCHADGTDFYTLPIIHDLTTGFKIGDSFEIAVYLDVTYPDGPKLFPADNQDALSEFNKEADAIFCTAGMFNPEILVSFDCAILIDTSTICQMPSSQNINQECTDDATFDMSGFSFWLTLTNLQPCSSATACSSIQNQLLLVKPSSSEDLARAGKISL